MPSSCIARINTQMLWQSTFAKTSFTCPWSLLDLTELPNFAFIMENSDSTLEGVMNFSSETVAFWYGDSKTIPKRRFRRRVGLCRPLSGARSRRRASAQPRAARGLQRAEVDRAHRLCLALYAPRPSAVGSHIPADEEMAHCRRLRGDGPRFARTLAAFGRQGD